MTNPTPAQLAQLSPEARELAEAAIRAGVADPRNTFAYVKRMVARVAWLNANAHESERRRRERLEADPARLTRLKRAGLKRLRRRHRNLGTLAL